MTDRIYITGDRTFNTGDDNVLFIVQNQAVLTIPCDDGCFQIGDIFKVFRETNGSVTIALDTDVMLLSAGLSITKQYGYITIQKIEENTWIGFGDF